MTSSADDDLTTEPTREDIIRAASMLFSNVIISNAVVIGNWHELTMDEFRKMVPDALTIAAAAHNNSVLYTIAEASARENRQ